MASQIERLDDYQRDHFKTSVAVATAKKFIDDQSTSLASMIAFWAFFSVFPLFLVLVTLLSWFLTGDTKDNVLSHVAAMFPLLDPSTVGSLTGSWWTLLVGLATSLWSGSAVVRTVQQAFNNVWEVPQVERPSIVEKLLRSLWVLATLGLGLVLATAISSFVTGSANGVHLGWAGRLGGYLIAIALDIGLFVAAFRMLTDRDISTRDVLPGALLSGISFWVLQQVSTLIISRYLQNAQSTYGHFATVITLLWWFYLQSILTLAGAQLNVVLKRHLYPRTLAGPPDTEAEKRSLQSYAESQTYSEEEDVRTSTRGEDGRVDVRSDSSRRTRD